MAQPANQTGKKASPPQNAAPPKRPLHPLLGLFIVALYGVLPLLVGQSGSEMMTLYGLATVCLVLTYYDLTQLRLPNVWVGVLALLGLAVFARGSDPLYSLVTKALTAVAVTLAFYLFITLYARLRNRSGMGMGDVKFIGAAAIWLPLTVLPLFLVIASGLAICSLLLIAVIQRKSWDEISKTRFPFGPFLCFSLFISYILPIL